MWRGSISCASWTGSGGGSRFGASIRHHVVDPSASARGFVESDRGTGFFGEDVLDRFLRVNGLSMVVRSHQLCQKGYLESFKGKLVTVWRARPTTATVWATRPHFSASTRDLKKSFVEFEASKENKAHALKVAAAGRR